MAMTPVVVRQDLWEGDDPGAMANWFFDEGATVREGDLLCEVMTEKVIHEVRAPVGGRLRILAATDAVVRKGSVIAEIGP